METRKYLSFYTVHGVLTASILEWFPFPSSSGPHIVRTLHYDPSVLCGLTWLIASLNYAIPFNITRQ